jgi:hypothetical protein
VQETNAIGTAFLRLDVLAPDAKAALKADLREYLDTRLAIYKALPDLDAAYAHLARGNAMQGTIWAKAVEG